MNNNDKTAKEAVNYFRSNNVTFRFSAGFNFSKIETEAKERYFFYSEHKNLKLLGLTSSLKSEIAKKVDKQAISQYITWLSVENSHVYNTTPQLTAWEYDLNAAFTHWLRLLWISESLYLKMIDIKAKYGFNINQSIGMALLGEKIIAKYKHGKPYDKEIILNPLRPCFYLIRYLTITTMKRVLEVEARKTRLAYYVDAMQVTQRLNPVALAKAYDWQALTVLENLEAKAQKYYNESIFKAFGIDKERIISILYTKPTNEPYFVVKERQLNNVILERQALTNKPMLQFSRGGEIIKYK